MKVNFLSEETTIIITSDLPWSENYMFQHKLAIELSRSNEVVFLNPPINWSPSSGIITRKHIFRINGNLIVLPYNHFFPVRIFRKLFTRLNDYFTSRRIRKYIRSSTDILIWRTDKFRFRDARMGKDAWTIYHVIENGFGKAFDNEMASESDLVVCTHRKYIEPYRTLNPDSIYMPPGIPEMYLNSNAADPSAIISGKYVFISGDVNSSYDLDLLQYLVRELPDLMFVVSGAVLKACEKDFEQIKVLQTNPNIRFIGSLNYEHMKAWISHASLTLIPRKVFEDEKPFKYPEEIPLYLLGKKNIISTVDPGVENQEKLGILYESDFNTIRNSILKALDHQFIIDKDLVENYLASLSLRSQINEIFKSLDKKYK